MTERARFAIVLMLLGAFNLGMLFVLGSSAVFPTALFVTGMVCFVSGAASFVMNYDGCLGMHRWSNPNWELVQEVRDMRVWHKTCKRCGKVKEKVRF